MGSKWIIDKHHIAIDTGDEIYHPSAEEIYSFLGDDEENLDFPSLLTDLKSLHFSKVGSPIKCELYSGEDNSIVLELYALRKNHKWSVDMIDGHIVDHCVSDREWFYINGDIGTLQGLLANASIQKCGEISIGQYIDLMKQEYFSEHKEIENNVRSETINITKCSEGEPPKEIKASLYEYQRVGYLWMKHMLEASRGCILGDEMGLGKTLQVITLFQNLKLDKNIPLLVVAPVSLLENWKRECEKFAPCLNVYIHHGSKRTGRYQELLKHDVIVISYNTAVSDLSMLKMIDWNCVALDEAQNIKNPYSERAKSVKAIQRKRSIAVTGTPFENHITDIWSLVDFAVPGLLGALGTFQQNVSDDVLGAEKIEPILSPVMIRRMVADVANDLPEKVIISQPIQMSEEERYKYEQFRQEARVSTENGKAVSLALIQRLRMFCTHSSLCEDKLSEDPILNSIKYQRLCEIVEEIVSRNEKVIVFTSYKKMFDVFLKDVPNRFGIKTGHINGETPVGERQQIVDDFNSYTGSCMLVLNPRAAGTGLNITGANHVIHYNLEWNPSLEDQSSARAYRRGQNKTVFIYRLYYVDTVEQVVNERIERKREIASTAVVGNDGAGNDRNDIIRALELAPEIQRKDE
jgi:SNF2 family DNA or RNA helicase